jgi:hypothetical protein
VLAAGCRYKVQKPGSVAIIAKDCLAAVTSIQQMIKGTFAFNSDLAGHHQLL